jgi:hypothetical protein
MFHKAPPLFNYSNGFQKIRLSLYILFYGVVKDFGAEFRIITARSAYRLPDPENKPDQRVKKDEAPSRAKF